MDKYNLGTIQTGITKTELWNGTLNTAGTTITLNDSVKNYKFIYLYFYTYSSTNHNSITMVIDTDDINISDAENAFLSSISKGNIKYFGFNFTNGYNKLTAYNIYGTFELRRIVGIN